jgi:hypothetical protein
MGESGRAPRRSSLLVVALVALATAAPAAAQTAAPANSSFKPSAHVRALQRAAGAGVPKKKSTTKKRTSSAPAAPRSFQPLPSTGSGLSKPASKKHGSRHHKRHKTHKPAASTYSPPRTTTDARERATFVNRVLHEVPTRVWILLGVLAALAGVLAANSIVSAIRTRRLGRQREMLRSDIGLLQSALLPVLPARVAGVTVSAAYRPASGPAAGGDFYDLFPLTG